MCRVVKYIDILGTDKYKKFINQNFHVDMLIGQDKIFSGWLQHDNNVIHNKLVSLDFSLENKEYFKINKKNEVITLNIPKTLGEFIEIMLYLGIDLDWSDYVDTILEPIDYMSPDQIKLYYREILNKLEKNEELLD